jgi:hypothetical protein
MRPVIAKRWTHCNRCSDDIAPGSKRMDETIRTRRGQRRIHYHYEDPSCYTMMLDAWFHQNTDGRTGRVGVASGVNLDITPEQRKERRRYLNRFYSLLNYYKSRLAFGKDMKALSDKELTQFVRFHKLREEILKGLENNGGVPSKYRKVTTPDLLPVSGVA